MKHPIPSRKLYSMSKPIGKYLRQLKQNSGLEYSELETRAREVDTKVLEPGEELEQKLENLETPGEKTKAIYLADAYYLKKILEESGHPYSQIEKVVVSGAGSENRYMNQIKKEHTGKQLIRSRAESTAALGAAIMAAEALGKYPSLETATRKMTEKTTETT
jgi:ribulose kinase